MTRTVPPKHDEGPLAALREAQAKIARVLNVGATAATSASLLVVALDFFFLDADRSWALGLTFAQSVLALVALGIAAQRDRRLPSRAPQRAKRIAYYGGLISLALLALLPKWNLALMPGALDRAAHAETYRVMGAAATLCTFVAAFGRERRLTRYVVAFAEHPGCVVQPSGPGVLEREGGLDLVPALGACGTGHTGTR